MMKWLLGSNERRQWIILPFCAFIVTTTDAAEPKGFYTIVDGQGRLIVIRTDNQSESKNEAQDNAVRDKKTLTEVSRKATHSKVVSPIQENQASKPLINKPPLVSVPASSVESLPRDVSKVQKQEIPVSLENQAEKSSPVPMLVKESDNSSVPHERVLPVQADVSKQVQSVKTQPEPLEKQQKRTQNQNIQTSVAKVDRNNTGKTKQQTELVSFKDDKYVDSQVLIDKSFNLKDEKRFYPLPNGTGGVDFIERKSGVNLKNVIPQRSPNSLFSTSSNYQRIPRDALAELLPSMCVSKRSLKKLKYLGSREPVNIWPRGTKTDDFSANLIELDQESREISVVSYAQRASDPTYYWPLAIFLDKKGCAIEAAGQFFQSDIPATWLQQSGLKGNLLAPENASYLMLTPLAQSPDLPTKTLTNRGQLRLSVYGSEP